ncbi:MAG TPA: DivIVA domain-containing protein [Candidatus Stackebrandtia excrementipullorum]|nr:DivIVA domain-containing protein [Candidatus Stackebrandtia excrementipullorum]
MTDPITVESVEQTEFPVVLRGYDQSAVDAFLETVAQNLRSGAPPWTEPVPSFPLDVKGYDRVHVDMTVKMLVAASRPKSAVATPRRGFLRRLFGDKPAD